MLRRDDAVFHDQAAQLFPKYWAAVRKDFQFVSAGQVYPDNPEVKHAAAVGESSHGLCTPKGNSVGIPN